MINLMKNFDRDFKRAFKNSPFWVIDADKNNFRPKLNQEVQADLCHRLEKSVTCLNSTQSNRMKSLNDDVTMFEVSRLKKALENADKVNENQRSTFWTLQNSINRVSAILFTYEEICEILQLNFNTSRYRGSETLNKSLTAYS